MAYSLMLNTSVVDGTPSPYINITGIATNWRRWTDWIGGYDIGEFTVHGDPGILLGYFESWMRMDVTEMDGGIVTWNGEIRKMDYVQGNMPKSMDFNECYNTVRCSYDGEHFSSFKTNDASITNYGVRQQILREPCDTETDADEESEYYLKKVGWPPLIASRNLRQSNEPPYLKVYVMGYKYSVNDKYSPIAIDAEDPISTALDEAIDDADYVSVRKIDTNANQINDPDNEYNRGWDYVETLLKMSDSSGNLFRGWINSNRKFFYKIWELTPVYYVRNGMVYSDTGTSMRIRPRWVQPGIFRDMDSLLTGANRGGLLNDRNDFLVERVMVDDQGNLGFSSADAYDFMTLLKSNESGGGGGGDDDHEMKWRWNKMTEEEQEWYVETHPELF